LLYQIEYNLTLMDKLRALIFRKKASDYRNPFVALDEARAPNVK